MPTHPKNPARSDFHSLNALQKALPKNSGLIALKRLERFSKAAKLEGLQMGGS